MELPCYLLLVARQKIKTHFGLGVLNKLTWLEPVIQSKTSNWSAVNFQKTADLDDF